MFRTKRTKQYTLAMLIYYRKIRFPENRETLAYGSDYMSDNTSNTDWGTEYILGSVKKQLGISQDDASFDIDITNSINMALAELNQLGAFNDAYLSSSTQTWNDLLKDYGDNTSSTNIKSMARQYVFLSTKILFDPPENSSVLQSYERVIDQLAWRILQEAEVGTES